MKALKERILKDGLCLEGGILKVDNFVNHQIDEVDDEDCKGVCKTLRRNQDR